MNKNTSTVAERNSNVTPRGTYTKSMVKRYKLTSQINDVAHNVKLDDINSMQHRKTVKRLLQNIKVYRGNVHRVYSKKLPTLFVNTAHYFADYIEVSPNMRSSASAEGEQ
jgi:hypothetical protein